MPNDGDASVTDHSATGVQNTASADPPLDAQLLGALAASLVEPASHGDSAVVEPGGLTEVAATNHAPVLAEGDVVLSWMWEDSGAPSGPVGTLISDIVDFEDAAGEVDRADYIPFYAAGSGDNSIRNIFLWKDGWDSWAENAQITLEKFGSLWIHLPYGRILGEDMPGDGRAEAAEGRAPYHGPLPQIAEGLAHYLEQIVRPTDELYFYFGAPSQLYEDGMTYEQYEALAFYEYEDALSLADNAHVFIGLDATYAQPTSFGGIWEVLGGVDGYNARLFQAITDADATVILEPWIYDGETWAYHYATVSSDLFYHNQNLHLGDDPKSDRWVDKSLKTGDHYRLLHKQSNIDDWHGGSWVQGIRDVLAAGEIPLVTPGDGPHKHAWVDFAEERISKDMLFPLPIGGSSGVAVPSSTSSAAKIANDNVADADIGALTGIALVDVDHDHGTWWYSLNNGDTWDLLGDVSTSAARMLAADGATRLYFQPHADVSGEITDAIRFRAWDQTDGFANGSIHSAASTGGATALSDQIGTGWLYVTPINDLPGITGASPRTVFASDDLDLSSLQIMDIDGGDVRVDISVSSGTLSLSSLSGLTFLSGDGSADKHIEFTSTLVDANAALATLWYTSHPSFIGVDGVSIFVDDQSNGGIGGAQTTSAFSQIEVVAAPAPPPDPPTPPPPPPPPPSPQPPEELPKLGAPFYVNDTFHFDNWLSNAIGGQIDRYSGPADTSTYETLLPSPPPLPAPAHESFHPEVRLAPSKTIDIFDDPSLEPHSLHQSHTNEGESDASVVEEFNELDRTNSDPPTKPAAPFAPFGSMPEERGASELETQFEGSDEVPPEPHAQPAEEIDPTADEDGEAAAAGDGNQREIAEAD